MKNCLRKWFRHFLLISLTTVGPLAATPTKAHDLPVFDTIEAFNCFGLNSPDWQFDSRSTGLTNRVATSEVFGWTNSGRQTYSADTPKLETIRTEPRQEFTYLGPKTSKFNSHFASPRSSHFTDGFAPIRTDIASSPDSAASDESQSCDNLNFNCFPARRFTTEGMPFDADGHGRSVDQEDSESSDDSASIGHENEAEASEPKDYVRIVPDLPAMELQSLSELFESSRKMIVNFDAAKAFSGLTSWLRNEINLKSVAVKPVDADSANGNKVSEHTTRVSNYLNSRRLVDDYLDGESFVRDLRSLRPFRSTIPVGQADGSVEQNWNNFIGEELPRAESTRSPDSKLPNEWSNLISAIETMECHFAQEAYSFSHTQTAGWYVGWAISAIDREASANIVAIVRQLKKLRYNQDVEDYYFERLGQPMFVIQKLDGKEFLLPAKQARHWNDVPQIISAKQTDWRTIAAKSATIGSSSRLKQQQLNNNVEVKNAQHSLNISGLSRNLVRSTSVALDTLASRIHGLANAIRLHADNSAQVAELDDGESVTK